MKASTAPAPLTRLPDGTVKQVNPLSGTEVWTVPGRADRPFGTRAGPPAPLGPGAGVTTCAFCPGRMLETPPEKARVVRGDGGWRTLEGVRAEDLRATVAEFRRISNLFEILSLDYWHTNHGYVPPAHLLAHERDYLATAAGRDHVRAILRTRALAGGRTGGQREEPGAGRGLAGATALFAGSHDVVLARRHYIDGATHDDELAGSGTLTVEEHRRYVGFTVRTARQLLDDNPLAAYVAVFQNWLRPAGASFDHLHKQLVAIDERGRQNDAEQARLAAEPNLYNDVVLGPALEHRLVVASNDHAVALAGIGHRYPTLEVWSTAAAPYPWDLTTAELAAVADLLHACHAATGTAVPSNEEWHYRPPGAPHPAPLRIMLKWRVSTLAGFEGGTKINVNTIAPDDLRDRVVRRLRELRTQGAVAPVAVGGECRVRPDALRYAEAR